MDSLEFSSFFVINFKTIEEYVFLVKSANLEETLNSMEQMARVFLLN
jgi:hypothetical protein